MELLCAIRIRPSYQSVVVVTLKRCKVTAERNVQAPTRRAVFWRGSIKHGGVTVFRDTATRPGALPLAGY